MAAHAVLWMQTPWTPATWQVGGGAPLLLELLELELLELELLLELLLELVVLLLELLLLLEVLPPAPLLLELLELELELPVGVQHSMFAAPGQ